MKNLNDLRKSKNPSDCVMNFVSVALLFVLIAFVISYLRKDLTAMITMGYGLFILIVSISNLRQRRINKLLIEELDKINQQAETKDDHSNE